MNKKLIAFAALPVIFGAVGFGAGKVMGPAPEPVATVEHASEPRSGAEKTLDRLAEEDAHSPKPVKPAAHAKDDHEARIIPASAPAPEKAAPKRIYEGNDINEAITAARSAPSNMPATKTARKASSVSAQTPDQPDLRKGMMNAKQIKDSKVVKLGRVTVPVQRANSITYVVTDIGVSVKDLETAAHFNVAENATRLRDAILMSMHRAADTQVMKGASIDTEVLSETLSSDLKEGFGEKLDEVLFLSLVKADVPRS